MLDSGLLDLAVRDALLAAREAKDAVPTVAGDTLVFSNTEVKFKVRGAVVYLDVLSAFTVLGRLREALGGAWAAVDALLAKRGIAQKTAFKKRGSVSGRSYMTLEAFRVVAEERGGPAAAQAAAVARRVEELVAKKDSLSRELEQTVEMILRTCRITPRDAAPRLGHRPRLRAEVLRDGEEVIDLSGSDAEVDVKKEESSEGAAVPGRRVRCDTLSTSEDDMVAEQVEEFAEVLGQKVPVLVSREQVYLGKAAVTKLLHSPLLLQKGGRVVDRLLEQHGVSLDEAVVYEGRQKGFLSTEALRVILDSEAMAKFAAREQMLEAIARIEASAGGQGDAATLSLASCGAQLRFRQLGGAVYLDLAQLVQVAGLFPDAQVSSRTNLSICKLLADRGVDLATCFLRQGKYKYAFLRLDAAAALLRADQGQQEPGRQEGLIREVLGELREQGIPADRGVLERGIKVCPSLPAIQYKVEGNCLFLHRKSAFEVLGLEAAIQATKKGYGGINSILVVAGLEPAACYLATKGQKYAYISCLALLRLLESKDPLVVCLPNKERFLLGLLARLQEGAAAVQGGWLEVAGGRLEVRAQAGTLYLHRQQAWALAGLGDGMAEFEEPGGHLQDRGLEPGACFLPRGPDR